MIRFIQKQYAQEDERILNEVLRDMINEEKYISKKNSRKSKRDQEISRRKYLENKTAEQIEKDNARLDQRLKKLGIQEEPDRVIKPPKTTAPKTTPKYNSARTSAVKEKVEKKVKEVAEKKKPMNKKALGLTALGTSGAIYGANKYKEYRQKEQLRHQYRQQFGLEDKKKEPGKGL